MIERFNRTLAGMIKSFVNANATNWDNHIHLLMAAYRSCVHPATGYTPNYLMLGREVNLSRNILFSDSNTCNFQSSTEYTQKLEKTLEKVYQTVREHLNTYAQRQKRDNDTRISQHHYQVDSLVYKFDNTINKKLRNQWVGPFKITKVISPVLYEIFRNNKREIIHYDKLKPCHVGHPDRV